MLKAIYAKIVGVEYYMTKPTSSLQRWEVHWINGYAIGHGKTLVQAVKKMNLTKRTIELGLLVKIRNRGITSWWDSRQFIKHAHLSCPRTPRGNSK